MPEIQRIDQPGQLEELLAASQKRPVWIFKHSLTCPVSARAIEEYRRFVDRRPADDPALYALLEVQKARPLSQAVAAATGVRHESPQAILLKDRAAAWHASHGRIREDALAGAAAGA